MSTLHVLGGSLEVILLTVAMSSSHIYPAAVVTTATVIFEIYQPKTTFRAAVVLESTD